MKKWYSINAQSENSAILSIFDDIGAYGVTAAQFIKDLESLGGVKNLTVKINSQGGNVQDGVAIYNALKQHPANVITEVNGWALSIASFIAMAGDTARMSSNGLLMIHNPWMSTTGDAAELRKSADVLDKTREALISGYLRSGKTRAELIALLDAETWFNADEAIKAGFIDEIQGGDPSISASIKSSKFSIPSRFLLQGKNQMNTQVTNPSIDEIKAAAIAAENERRKDIKRNFFHYVIRQAWQNCRKLARMILIAILKPPITDY